MGICSNPTTQFKSNAEKSPKHRRFLCFCFCLETVIVRCLSVIPKNSPSRRISVRHLVRSGIHLMLLINAIRHARHRFRLSLLKRMRINVQRGICVIVTKASLHRFHIDTALDHNGGVKMAEGVDITETDFMPLAEVFKILVRRTDAHWTAVPLGKQAVMLRPL